MYNPFKALRERLGEDLKKAEAAEARRQRVVEQSRMIFDAGAQLEEAKLQREKDMKQFLYRMKS